MRSGQAAVPAQKSPTTLSCARSGPTTANALPEYPRTCAVGRRGSPRRWCLPCRSGAVERADRRREAVRSACSHRADLEAVRSANATGAAPGKSLAKARPSPTLKVGPPSSRRRSRSPADECTYYEALFLVGQPRPSRRGGPCCDRRARVAQRGSSAGPAAPQLLPLDVGEDSARLWQGRRGVNGGVMAGLQDRIE